MRLSELCFSKISMSPVNGAFIPSCYWTMNCCCCFFSGRIVIMTLTIVYIPFDTEPHSYHPINHFRWSITFILFYQLAFLPFNKPMVCAVVQIQWIKFHAVEWSIECAKKKEIQLKSNTLIQLNEQLHSNKLPKIHSVLMVKPGEVRHCFIPQRYSKDTQLEFSAKFHQKIECDCYWLLLN